MKQNSLAAEWPRVVIVGAGFGGLTVAKALAKTPVDITVIDQHNYHLFQPLCTRLRRRHSRRPTSLRPFAPFSGDSRIPL
jgi:NADH dehydrogenase FAD-containing subunit